MNNTVYKYISLIIENFYDLMVITIVYLIDKYHKNRKLLWLSVYGHRYI